MIGKITGKIDYLRNNYAIVDVAGVGYRLHMTEISLGQVSKMENVELFVHTYVREDQITLYGFLELEEQEMFELLISISGIGPKAAMGILTIANPKAIKTAIINEDPSILTRVSGVGKKTAERVILELQNKIEDLPESDKTEATADQEVIEALVGMGYKISEAREAAKAVPADARDISERIKLALRNMGK